MAGLVDFSDEEEVQEYLNNTEVEFMFGCHKEHQEDSCYRLGEFLETIRKKFTEAGTIYKECCTKYKNAPCCTKAGHFHMLGKGGLKESKLEAFKCYETACAQDTYTDQGKNDRLAIGCCNYGILLCDQEFVSDNKEYLSRNNKENVKSSIIDAFKRACSLQDRHGCTLLSQFYMSNYGEDRTKSFKLSAQYAEKACELGDVRSCHNLSLMYTRGDGVEKDPKLAKKYAQLRDNYAKDALSLTFGDE